MTGTLFQTGPLGQGQFFQRLGGHMADVQAESCLVRAAPTSWGRDEYMITPFLLKTRIRSIPSWLPRASMIWQHVFPIVEEHAEAGGPLDGFTEAIPPQDHAGEELFPEIINIEIGEGADGEQQEEADGKAHLPGQALAQSGKEFGQARTSESGGERPSQSLKPGSDLESGRFQNKGRVRSISVYRSS